MSNIHPQAMSLIHQALRPMLDSGKRIDRILLKVSTTSALAQFRNIQTDYGQLRIDKSYIPRGYCYLVEKPLSRGGIGFNWVTKPDPSNTAK